MRDLSIPLGPHHNDGIYLLGFDLNANPRTEIPISYGRKSLSLMDRNLCLLWLEIPVSYSRKFLSLMVGNPCLLEQEIGN
ncbi:hypothetical protein J6590_008916 [Homalodisca vitripennis]|nr:hypothetical protein J6590_008916 [Homalodisca vitripennis]